MTRTFLTTVLLSLLALSKIIAADFSEMKLIYEKEKQKIDWQLVVEKNAARDAYAKALAAGLERVKKAGDLESYTVIKKEQDRLGPTNTIPRASSVSNPHIQKAAGVYEKSVQKAEVKSGRAGSILKERYAKALEPMIKKLMQADKIDEAMAVKKELDALKAETAAATESPAAVKPEPAAGKDKVTVKKISLINSSLASAKWKKRVPGIPGGAIVTVSSELKPGLEKVPFSPRCFAVRLGVSGAEKWFDSNGRHRCTNYAAPCAPHPKAALTATEDCEIYIIHTQKNRFTLTVEIREPAPAK